MMNEDQLAEVTRLINEEGLDPLEAMSVAKGQKSIEEIQIKKQRRTDALQWKGKASSEWPEFELRWSDKEENFKYSLDGVSSDNFAKQWPKVALGDVLLSELVANLHPSSKRHESPWEAGFAEKTAELIEWWNNGHTVSPPLIKIIDSTIFLAGGNHRFHVAHEKGAQFIPILFESSATPVLLAIAPSLTTPPTRITFE